MKKPLLFGFAALCVLSTPNLLEEKSPATKDITYRTIASQELRPDNRPDKAPKSSIKGEDKGSRPPHPRLENPPIDKEVSESKDQEENKESVEKVAKESTKENKVVEKVEEKPELERDITVCEYRNEIEELKQQISDLLEDKEEVLAEVDNKEKKKKSKDEDKSEDKDKKEERVASIPSRYQQILSMGLIFGQGFQSSFQMPMMRFGSNSFLNTQLMFNQNNKSPYSFFQNDTSWITPGIRSMMNVGSEEAGLIQPINNNTNRQTFIPSFTRTSIKAEGFSIK